MSSEEIQRITANAVAMALAQDRAERDRQVKVATEAAVAAALANQTSQVNAINDNIGQRCSVHLLRLYSTGEDLGN